MFMVLENPQNVCKIAHFGKWKGYLIAGKAESK